MHRDWEMQIHHKNHQQNTKQEQRLQRQTEQRVGLNKNKSGLGNAIRATFNTTQMLFKVENRSDDAVISITQVTFIRL